MSVVVWVMMGIAVWHFTVFLPDRFWGGIVGAFVAAFLAAASSASSYGADGARQERHRVAQALIAVPGSMIGLASPTCGALAWTASPASTTATRSSRAH